MIRYLFIILFLFSCNIENKFQKSDSTYNELLSFEDSLKIVDVMKKQESAWNNGDIELFMNGYIRSENLVFSGKNGPVFGWKQTLERYLKSYPDKIAMGNLEFKILQIKPVIENVAYLIGEYYLERENNKNSNGHFTLIWKKIDNQWLIISDHTSSAN